MVRAEVGGIRAGSVLWEEHTHKVLVEGGEGGSTGQLYLGGLVFGPLVVGEVLNIVVPAVSRHPRHFVELCKGILGGHIALMGGHSHGSSNAIEGSVHYHQHSTPQQVCGGGGVRIGKHDLGDNRIAQLDPGRVARQSRVCYIESAGAAGLDHSEAEQGGSDTGVGGCSRVLAIVRSSDLLHPVRQPEIVLACAVLERCPLPLRRRRPRQKFRLAGSVTGRGIRERRAVCAMACNGME